MTRSFTFEWAGSTSSLRWPVAVALLSMLAQAWCLTGYFQADDYLHLYELATVPYGRLLVTTYSGHILSTFHVMLSVLHGLFGFHPTGYFVVILLTHGINAALLCRVAQRFASAGSGALAAWGTTPVHQGAVGFISVYGHVLAATCLLAALVLLIRAFERDQRWALAGSFLFVLLGVGSFGVGIAVASVFPIVAWLLAPDRRTGWRAAAWLAPLAIVPVAYLLTVGAREAGYHSEDSLAALRLAAQCAGYGLAVLLFGAFCTLNSGLHAASPLWGISADPIVHFGCALWLPFGALLAWIMWRGRPAERRGVAAGLLWAAAAYGIIAVGRVNVSWSEYLPPGMLFPPSTSRYQYLPLTGVAVALGSAIAAVARALRTRSWYALAARASVACVLLLAIASPFVGRYMWTLDTRLMALHYMQFLSWALAPPKDADGDVFVLNDEFGPTRFVREANTKSARFPGMAAFFATIYPSNVVGGRRVYFVEKDAQLLAAVQAADNERMHALLIGEEDAARRGAAVVSFADFRKAEAAARVQR